MSQIIRALVSNNFRAPNGPGLAAEDIPACNLADCTVIGELDYPADDGAALDVARAQRMATLVDALNAAHAALGAGVSTLEQATWPTQLAEALALTACPPGTPSDSLPPSPLLTLMAAQRGRDETPRNLAARVLAAAARYTAAAGALVAWGQRTEWALAEAGTAETLMAVDVTPPSF